MSKVVLGIRPLADATVPVIDLTGESDDETISGDGNSGCIQTENNEENVNDQDNEIDFEETQEEEELLYPQKHAELKYVLDDSENYEEVDTAYKVMVKAFTKEDRVSGAVTTMNKASATDRGDTQARENDVGQPVLGRQADPSSGAAKKIRIAQCTNCKRNVSVPEGLRFQCPCGQRMVIEATNDFDQRNILNEHRNTHGNFKPHQCK